MCLPWTGLTRLLEHQNLAHPKVNPIAAVTPVRSLDELFRDREICGQRWRESDAQEGGAVAAIAVEGGEEPRAIAEDGDGAGSRTGADPGTALPEKQQRAGGH